MPEISFSFEMTDALMAQAVREDCAALAREHVSVRDLLLILASTAIFALAIVGDSHWIWWFAGLPTLLFALVGVGWAIALIWLPRAATAKLAHLPHRMVHFKATDTLFSFQTASERLEVAWSELKALKRRPNFWVVCLRSSGRIPIPAPLLSAEDVAVLHSRL